MQKWLIYCTLLLFTAFTQQTDQNMPGGYFPIKEFGKWGYINSEGKTVIPCQFAEVSQFSEGLAAVRIDTLWGFIDTTGNLVITPRFYRTAQFSDGLCQVAMWDGTTFKRAFITKTGTIAFTTNLPEVGSFYDGRAMVTIKEHIGFIDKTGKVVIQTLFPYGSNFKEGIAKVWTGDSSQYLDTAGRIIAAFSSMGGEDFSEGLARVNLNEKPVYIDKSGKVKINPADSTLTFFNFSEGLAQCTIAGIDHKTGFIDTTGSIVIPIQYDQITDFKEGLAAYRDKNQWGFIDTKGKTVIKPQFQGVDYTGFSNGLCWAKQDGQWGYITHSGTFVWKEQSGIEYEKIDLSKWELDTLAVHEPFSIKKYAPARKHIRKQPADTVTGLVLKVDTSNLTVYADNYYAFKLYLINASKDTIQIPAQDGRIAIIQQAKNKKGRWQDIETFTNSFCGNSYHTIPLVPTEFRIIAVPVFKGNYQTKLRFRLDMDNKQIFSNEYSGQIHTGQFVAPRKHTKRGIAVWTN